EEPFAILTEQRARVTTHVLDAVLFEPGLYFGKGMTMLFWVLILVAQPSCPARRLVLPIAQDRIEGNNPISGHPGDEAAYPERQTGNGIVKSEHDDPARTGERRDSCESRSRIRRVVQDA